MKLAIHEGRTVAKNHPPPRVPVVNPGFLGSSFVFLLFAQLALLTACSQGVNMDDKNGSAVQANDEDQPLRRLNPSPRQAYTITMTLADAPGPFASVEGTVQYTVANSAECGRKIPIAGAFPRISSNEPFALTRVSDTEYVGTVYADLILDEDYFGRGVCRWEFVEARVRLRATPDDRDTRFVPSIAAEEVAVLGKATRFFWRGGYPREEGYDGFPDFGKESPDVFKPELRDELFTITLEADEVQS